MVCILKNENAHHDGRSDFERYIDGEPALPTALPAGPAATLSQPY
jgi:hypothetical protein